MKTICVLFFSVNSVPSVANRFSEKGLPKWKRLA